MESNRKEFIKKATLSLMGLKWVLFFTPLFFAFPGFSQIQEIQTNGSDWKLYGQVKYVGPAKASLQYIERGRDTSYLLMMYDQRSELKNYFSVNFSSRGNTLEELYIILMSFFERENLSNKEYIRMFLLGDEKISVYRSPTLGSKGIILKSEKGRIELRKGEIQRLFNRD